MVDVILHNNSILLERLRSDQLAYNDDWQSHEPAHIVVAACRHVWMARLSYCGGKHHNQQSTFGSIILSAVTIERRIRRFINYCQFRLDFCQAESGAIWNYPSARIRY